MGEETVNETVENTELETVEQTEETQVEELENEMDAEETEAQEESEEFDPDKISFEEEAVTTFGSYDLSKFKDSFDFTDPNVTEVFSSEVAKLEKLGASQELIEYFVETMVDLGNQEAEANKLTNETVKESLNKYLSTEEKRNYKAVSNFTVEALKGTDMENDTKEILSNPFIVKLINSIYKKSSGNKTINKANVEQGQKINYTVEAASKKYDEYIKGNPESTREEKKTFLTNMYTKLGETEKVKFEDIYDGLFNKN